MLFTFSNHLNADLRSFHLPPFLAWNCWDLPKRTPAEIRFVLGFRPLDSWPERGSKEDAAWAVGVGAGCLVWAVLTFVMSKWVVDKQLKWQANEQQGESWAPTSSFLADGFKVVFLCLLLLGMMFQFDYSEYTVTLFELDDVLCSGWYPTHLLLHLFNKPWDQDP